MRCQDRGADCAAIRRFLAVTRYDISPTKIAVLYYSASSNNRLLAQTLAGRFGAEMAEVRETELDHYAETLGTIAGWFEAPR